MLLAKALGPINCNCDVVAKMTDLSPQLSKAAP